METENDKKITSDKEPGGPLENDSGRSFELILNELKGKELAQNLSERKKYAKQLFMMLSIWLAVMLVILTVNAVGQIPGTHLTFMMSDPVIITLITTTTANIAAFFLVVTKYLFPTSM